MSVSVAAVAEPAASCMARAGLLSPGLDAAAPPAGPADDRFSPRIRP